MIVLYFHHLTTSLSVPSASPQLLILTLIVAHVLYDVTPPYHLLKSFAFVIDCFTDTYTTLNTFEFIGAASATVRNNLDIESDST